MLALRWPWYNAVWVEIHLRESLLVGMSHIGFTTFSWQRPLFILYTPDWRCKKKMGLRCFNVSHGASLSHGEQRCWIAGHWSEFGNDIRRGLSIYCSVSTSSTILIWPYLYRSEAHLPASLTYGDWLSLNAWPRELIKRLKDHNSNRVLNTTRLSIQVNNHAVQFILCLHIMSDTQILAGDSGISVEMNRSWCID